LPAAIENVLRAVAEMTTRFGVDRDSTHDMNLTTKTPRHQGKNRSFFMPWCLGG
jgi:hypothetical protein